jgi:sugar/nucleoside kinase (ribokinase family)
MVDVLLLPELRQEEQAAGLALRGGGSAANTAGWLAHLGHDAAFIGCVGGDAPGNMLVEELRHARVRTHVRRVGAETGCVAVEITPLGERLMRSSRGANQALSPDDILDLDISAIEFVHLTGYALLGPYGLEMLRAGGKLARRVRAVLTFDPSSLGVIGKVGADRLLSSLSECGVGIFLPNREEAEALTGQAEPEGAALALLRATPRVAVKCGRDGSCFADDSGHGRLGTRALQPVDSTGAGDAFNAGLLAGLSKGLSLPDACELGNQVAGQAVMRLGGRPPSPTV